MSPSYLIIRINRYKHIKHSFGIIKLMFYCKPIQYFIHIRIYKIIRFDNSNIIPTCHTDSKIHLITITFHWRMNKFYSLILITIILQYFQCSICRACINAYNLNILQRLIYHAFNTFFYIWGNIQRWHNNRYFHYSLFSILI